MIYLYIRLLPHFSFVLNPGLQNHDFHIIKIIKLTLIKLWIFITLNILKENRKSVTYWICIEWMNSKDSNISFLCVFSICFILCLKTGSHYVVQVVLEFKILLTQTAKYWDFRCMSSYLIQPLVFDNITFKLLSGRYIMYSCNFSVYYLT
jgi:hypothetical protein